MDNYEVNFPGHTPDDAPQDPPVSENTPQKKASPFADSPYVMNHDQQESNDTAYAPQWPPEASDPQPKAPKSKKHPRKVWKTVLSCAVVAALVAAGCGITAASVNSYWEQRSAEMNAQTGAVLDKLNDKIEDLEQQIEKNSYTGSGNSISGSTNTSADGMTPGQLYANCVDSVVAITSEVVSSQGTGTSSGSGFIISEDGYVLSNYHVVEGATTMTVVTRDGNEYEAELVGYDSNNDLALLKVEAEGLKAATLGSSSDLIVGDQVVAIGNPLGELTSTLTVGYVSGKERDVTTDGTIINMLQTDAAINPGNSGGPLFNMKGEVIGITTAKYSGTTSSGASIEGIGFAIPIDDVVEKIQELKENGYVSTPYMGVSVDDRYSGVGAYVVSVEKDGGAAAAGVKAGDIIVGLGDSNITCVSDISKALRNFKVGDTTTITVYRSRQQVELTITFGEKPQDTSTGSTSEIPSDSSEMPESGNFEDWWDYFFGGGNG